MSETQEFATDPSDLSKSGAQPAVSEENVRKQTAAMENFQTTGNLVEDFKSLKTILGSEHGWGSMSGVNLDGDLQDTSQTRFAIKNALDFSSGDVEGELEKQWLQSLVKVRNQLLAEVEKNK